MPRPRRRRFVEEFDGATYFKPAGVCMRELSEVVLFADEFEALRLKDCVGKNQQEAAEQMGISQPTFHRLVTVARKKVVDALVNGKAIRIEK